MKRFFKLFTAIMMVLIMTMTVCTPCSTANAKTKTTTKKVSVTATKSKTVKTKKKIKSVKTSNKKVATVKKNGKKFTITGKKAGKATITVKTTSGTTKYKVTIKRKPISNLAANTTTEAPANTEAPTTEAPATTETTPSETNDVNNDIIASPGQTNPPTTICCDPNNHQHNMQPSGTETTWVAYENIYEQRVHQVKYPYADITNWSETDKDTYDSQFYNLIHPNVWAGEYNRYMSSPCDIMYHSYALVGKKAVIHHKQTYKCNDPCAQYHSGVGCTKTETKEWTTDGDITTYCPICGAQTSIGNDIMKYWQTVDTTYGYNPNTDKTKAIVTDMGNYATLCPNCMPANQFNRIQYEIDNHFDDFVVWAWGDMVQYDENGNWLYPITGIGAQHDLTVINAKRAELGIPVYRPLELWDEATTPYWY